MRTAPTLRLLWGLCAIQLRLRQLRSVESFDPLSLSIHGSAAATAAPAARQPPGRCLSTLWDARSTEHEADEGEVQGQGDESLLAERLSPRGIPSSPTMPWLPQQQNSAPEAEEPWFALLPSDDGDGGDSTLPFACTGCGNCCKTRGDVYLSPSETKGAAKLLGLLVHDFKMKHAAEEEVTVAMSLDPDEVPPGETGWAVLRHREDGSCVFLKEDNLCAIYEARPLQCSTYPFWPRIMASRESWNSEVRLEGEAPKGQDTTELLGRAYWSVEEGGCEGMRCIERDERDGTITASIGEGGVPAGEAKERLFMYERYKQRFPNTELRPLRDS